MNIREARIRDVAAIAGLIPESAAITEDKVMGMIAKKDPKIYVAADFSANIHACALGADKIYVSPNCMEEGVLDALAKMY